MDVQEVARTPHRGSTGGSAGAEVLPDCGQPSVVRDDESKSNGQSYSQSNGQISTQHYANSANKDRTSSSVPDDKAPTSDTKIGGTHLHLACQENFESICTMLDMGADPRARDFEGDTPLHCVAFPQMIDVVQQSGADVNARNNKGKTPLHSAVDRDDFDVFRALLRAGANPALRDRRGRSVLDLACVHENEDMVHTLVVECAVDVTRANCGGLTALHFAEGKKVVDMLVDAGADVHAQDREGRTPLHFVCSKNNFTLCALLSRGADINALDTSSQTPLHRLSKGIDDAGRVVFMIKKGANVHAKSFSGKTPLHLATQRGRVAMTQTLLQAGANVRDLAHGGLSALVMAAANNRLRLVEILIGRGASVNGGDDIGQTPLHYAVFKGHASVATALLCAGANPTSRTHRGKSALDLAVTGGHVAIVEAIVDSGANVDALDNFGQTPLHHACRLNCIAIARLLVEAAGANMKLRDYGDMAPLDIAAVHGRDWIVATLLRNGGDAAAADHRGWTALHYSAKNGHLDVSTALMDAGADPTVRNVSQVTPLDLAVAYGYTCVVTQMIVHGAVVTDVDTIGLTPLHLAGTSPMVDVLVAAGADVNAQNYDGNTPIMYQSVDLEIVTALLKHEAQVNVQNEEGQTVLHMVLKNGRADTMVDVVDMLLRAGADETLFDNHGLKAEDCFDDETPGAHRALRLLCNAPRDRAWRRRGILLLCMESSLLPSENSKLMTRSRNKSRDLANWLLDTRGGTEGIFREIVGYL